MYKNIILSSLILRLIYFLVFAFSLYSCKVEYSTESFTISGKLIDSPNNASFRNVKIEAYNTFTARGFKYLGECYTNEFGEFSLGYNLDYKISGNYLKLYFDTAFAASSKYVDMPIGESWNKNLYVGDSATVDIYLNRNLNFSDTLFIQTAITKLEFVGPTFDKHIGKIRLINTGAQRQFSYAVGANKYNSSISIFYHLPTGDPIVDVITLKLDD